MPNLEQLPEAVLANPTDLIMLDQSGQSTSITVGTLLNGLQPQLTLAQGALLGRASITPGPPEPIALGLGLKLTEGVLVADTTIVAPVVSPSLTGTPTAPTPPVGDSSNTIATTAFVQAKYYQPLTITGDLSGTGSPLNAGVVNATLPAITAPGTYVQVSVNAKGQVTGGSTSLTTSDIAGIDISSAEVTAAGSSTPRTLAQRMEDRINVLDLGADPTGVVDFAPAFQAMAAAMPSTGFTIWFPKGNYRFNSPVYVSDKALIDIDGGVTFVGGGHLNTDADTSVLPNQQAAKTLMRLGGTDGNSFTLYASQLISTTGTVSYEKAAIYAAAASYDKSTYTLGTAFDTGTTTKDAVGLQANGNVLPGNTAGRAWGICAEAAIASGADGSAVGIEVDVVNNGAAQPENSRWNSKTGLQIVNFGPNQVTNGLAVVNGGGEFYDGLSVQRNAVSRNAFVLRDLSTYPSTTPAFIDNNGNALFQSLTLDGNGVASAYSSTWTAGNPGNGAFQWTYTGAVPSTGVIGPLTTIYNNGPHCAQGEKFQYFTTAGDADSVDSAQSLIGIFNPTGMTTVNAGAELVRWTVGITPNDTTHNWTHVVEEYNVVNRGLDVGWKAYRNDPVNNITGPQQITGIVNYSPEATGLGQPGEGKNLLFAELFGQSAATNSTGLPARFYNASMYEPNCVVGGVGRAIYINGDLTGQTAQIPYAPLEVSLSWLHGLRTVAATFADGAALTMANGQSVAWSNGTSTASISASGTGVNQSITLSPAGTGTVYIAKLQAAGGSIDNTQIGAGTPSAGAFTTLSVSGTINASAIAAAGLISTTGSLVAAAMTTTGSLTAAAVNAGAGSIATTGTISAGVVKATGTLSAASLTTSVVSAPTTASLALGTAEGTILDITDNGVPALSKVILTPGNGGQPATIAVSGETNQGLNFRSAGTGQINFQSGSGGSSNALTIVPNATAVNALSITGGSTGQNVVLGVNGSDPNVTIQLVPQGSGTVYIGKLQGVGGTVDNIPIGSNTPSSGIFTTLRTNGLASFTAGLADASFSSQTPTTGFAIAVANGVSTLQLTPAGTLASGTITLPSSPGNGQWLLVTSTSAVTACSFLPGSGQSILGAPTTLPAYVEMAFQYQTTSARWVCQSGNDSRVAAVASTAALMFGTGADGAVAMSSGATTLTRDMHYTNLTISGTAVLNPGGWRVFVSGTLDVSGAAAGAIVANGITANNGSGATAGGAPSGISQRTVGQSPQTGGAGGSGSTTTGTAGTAGASNTYGNGGNGGSAGAGGLSTSSGGAGGSGGVETVQIPLNTPTFTFCMPANNIAIASGLIGGGGGGGGGDGTNAGGGGGSGGSYGGIVALYARNVQRGINTTASIIQAKGSNGGNGGSATAGNTAGGGGGGGGGGGLIYIITEALLGTSITNALDVSGGTGGTGGNGVGTGKGGSGGSGGAAGSVQILNLLTPSFTASAWNSPGTTGSSTSTPTGAAGGAGGQLRSAL